MKPSRIVILTLSLVLVITAACKESLVANESQPIVTKVVTDEELYWDGDEFAGQPVYSLSRGVSQVLHDAFEECLLGEEEIETAVQNYVTNGTERQLIQARLSEDEVLWTKSITVTALNGDVYALSCSREGP